MFDPTLLYLGLSVFLLGIAKGGFGGVGTPVALPIMVLGVSPELALGALLPILIAMDVVSVGSHHRDTDKTEVLFALPGAVIGILLGAVLIAAISPELIGTAIGILAILFAVMALTGFAPRLDGWPNWTGGIFGAVSGLASTLAHAGGPPIHIYLLSRGYTQAQFVATSAMFMAGMNLLKIIPFIAVGALTVEALKLALYLSPLAVASAFLGVQIARRISKGVFKIAVNSLMILVGIKLILDALI